MALGSSPPQRILVKRNPRQSRFFLSSDGLGVSPCGQSSFPCQRANLVPSSSAHPGTAPATARPTPSGRPPPLRTTGTSIPPAGKNRTGERRRQPPVRYNYGG